MNDRKRTALEDKWASEGDAAGEAGARPDGPASEAAAEVAPQIAELEGEIARLRDQLLRQKAEMVNFRRRTERDRADLRDSSRGAVIRELLPVIDDFERALSADTDNLEAYREGVELILRALQDTLDRLGVTRIDPQGAAFDPHEHEAVEQQITSEVPAGHVIAVYGPGYRLGERLLRPASVAVAAAPPESGDEADS